MLGKLFKHELRAVSKVLIMIHIALLAFSMIGRIVFYLVTTNKFALSDSLSLMTGLYMVVYVFGIFIVTIITWLYLAKRFQKNLFSDEGYLMHTLPVTPAQHIWSKFFVFGLWSVIDLIAIIASVLLIFVNSFTLPVIQDSILKIWDTLLQSFHMSGIVSTIYMLISSVLSIFFTIFFIYFCICIGNLFKTHKTLGAIGTFLVIYLVMTFTNGIMMVTTGMLNTTVITEAQTVHYASANSIPYLLINLGVDIIITVVFYAATHYILSKRLNLE